MLLTYTMSDETVLSIRREGEDFFIHDEKTDKPQIIKTVKKFLGLEKQHKKYNSRLKGFKDVIMFSIMSTQERHIQEDRDCSPANCFIHQIAERYGLKKSEETNEFSITEIEKAVTNEIELELI